MTYLLLLLLKLLLLSLFLNLDSKNSLVIIDTTEVMPPSGHLLPSKEHPLRVKFRSLCNIREDKNLCKILRFCTKINSPISFRQPTSFHCINELKTLLQMNYRSIYIILSTQSRVIGFNRCRSFEILISIAAQLIKMRNKNRKEILYSHIF